MWFLPLATASVGFCSTWARRAHHEADSGSKMERSRRLSSLWRYCFCTRFFHCWPSAQMHSNVLRLVACHSTVSSVFYIPLASYFSQASAERRSRSRTTSGDWKCWTPLYVIQLRAIAVMPIMGYTAGGRG
jgi:hypothetical protein